MSQNNSNTDTLLLWKKWKEEGRREAQNELIKIYLPLVSRVAKKISKGLPSHVDAEDLHSYGNFGLLDAMNKFDYNRGNSFESYASFRIHGAIMDGLRKSDTLPRSMRDKMKKIEEVYSTLEQESLRSVSDREVSQKLGMSVQEVGQILQQNSFSNALSLDEPIFDDGDNISRKHIIRDDNSKSPEELIDEQQIKDSILKVIERLPDKERIVISLFYYEELTLTEIAEVLDLSPSRISQIHSKAISRLKEIMAKSITLD